MTERIFTTQKGLSSYHLKVIAVISMIIDHIGSIIFGFKGILKPYVIDGVFRTTPDMPDLVRNSLIMQEICDILGRVAFPLFCFLLVQGFIHTRSKEKYILRLGIFALLSEIPYNIAHFQTLFSFRLQNVLFTFVIGFLTLYALEKIINYYKGNKQITIFLGILTVLLGVVLTYLIRSEYAMIGIVSLTLFYLLRNNKKLQMLGIVPLLVASPFVLLALIPIALYNGTKGKSMKFFFYGFYPVHFLVLVFIKEWVTRII